MLLASHEPLRADCSRSPATLAGTGDRCQYSSLATYVLQQYYRGNELLFLAGLLFGIDAERTKDVVVER